MYSFLSLVLIWGLINFLKIDIVVQYLLHSALLSLYWWTVRWYHCLNGHEFEQTLGNGEGQGSLACCSPWDHRVGHDWATEQPSKQQKQMDSTTKWGTTKNKHPPIRQSPWGLLDLCPHQSQLLFVSILVFVECNTLQEVTKKGTT